MWQFCAVPFPDGRWIQSTLRLGFYCLPGLSMLQSSSCHTHHKAISDLCWILATIVINKINSLEKKKEKKIPFCSWQYGRCDFSQRMQKWLPVLFQNCLLQGCSFARLWHAEVIFSCVANYKRSKIAWKNSPFPPL